MAGSTEATTAAVNSTTAEPANGQAPGMCTTWKTTAGHARKPESRGCAGHGTGDVNQHALADDIRDQLP
jgi:hypothetical protein